MLKILSFVEPCKTVADIGCDHGKVGAELVLSEMCKNCVFSDISEPSLSKAKALAEEKNIAKKCKFIVCDGLTAYPKKTKIDCAIISGMGGIEIASIVLNKPASVEVAKFVLQPNNNVVYLRKALVKNGFKVLKDEVVREGGMFYNILLVECGTDKLTKDELEFGRTNLIKLSLDFLDYLEFRLEKLKAILNGVKGTEKETEVENLISQITKYLKGRKINATRNK